MKITKSQLKQIIKEELGRSLEEEEHKGRAENLLTDLETITEHLQKIKEITEPDSMESEEQVDLYGGESESEEQLDVVKAALKKYKCGGDLESIYNRCRAIARTGNGKRKIRDMAMNGRILPIDI